MKLFNKKVSSLLLVTILITFVGITSVNAYCNDFKTETQCKDKDTGYSCVWNENEIRDYCNTDNLTYVQCGGAYDIPSQVPKLTSFAVNLLKIATPIILIIVSIITLVKAVASSKEDEMKKAQKGLTRKVIAAALVFFVISIVQFVILKVADGTEASSISNCMSCFIDNKCSDLTYYKTAFGNGYKCTYLKNGKEFKCN